MHISVFQTLVFLGSWYILFEVQAIELEKYPDLNDFISEMENKHSFNKDELRNWFERSRIRPEIIEAMERPSEALPWYEYRKRFVTDSHTQRGVKYWEENSKALVKARKKYGVPPEIILAIIGVETRYGRNTGSFPVLDALATLSFEYPKRSQFFRKEMEHFLLLTREMKIDPLSIKGSYAGAMGIPQFMPSSYREYAVDFDGDKKPDLISNTTDTIGSVANYFKRHGWRSKEPIFDDVKIEGDHYLWFENLGLKPKIRLKHFMGYGIFPLDNKKDAELDATLMKFEEESGPIYRFGYTNFYVITRYNHSKNYAMAVVELSQQIREAYNSK